MIYRIAFLPSTNLLSMKRCPKALPLSLPCLVEVIVIRKATLILHCQISCLPSSVQTLSRALPPECALLKNSLDGWVVGVWVIQGGCFSPN